MYDAVDDPYTYENSTVLINKLDLRDRAELDDFEAEISSARANEPLPEGNLDFVHYCACIVTSFRMYTNGPVRRARYAFRSRAIRSAFPSTSTLRQTSCSPI